MAFLVETRSLVQTIAQLFTFEQFSHHIKNIVMGVDVMNRENIRMVERAGRLCFLFKARDAFLVGGNLG